MTIYAHTSLEAKYKALTKLDERIGKEPLSSDWRHFERRNGHQAC